ncbi:hypothetical protein [Lentilactobacillus hilgardii]
MFHRPTDLTLSLNDHHKFGLQGHITAGHVPPSTDIMFVSIHSNKNENNLSFNTLRSNGDLRDKDFIHSSIDQMYQTSSKSIIDSILSGQTKVESSRSFSQTNQGNISSMMALSRSTVDGNNGGETVVSVGTPSGPQPGYSSPSTGSTPTGSPGYSGGTDSGGSSTSQFVTTNPISSDNAAVKLIQTSATGADEYKKLTDAGWRLYWTNEMQSLTDTKSQTIGISQQYMNSPDLAASQLAHEMGHALDQTPVDYSSRDNFLRTSLEGEGEATVNNIKISLEVGVQNIPISGSPDLIDTYIREYNDGLHSGDMGIAYREIGDTYGSSEKTGAGVPYAQMYLGWYDHEYAQGWFH